MAREDAEPKKTPATQERAATTKRRVKERSPPKRERVVGTMAATRPAGERARRNATTPERKTPEPIVQPANSMRTSSSEPWCPEPVAASTGSPEPIQCKWFDQDGLFLVPEGVRATSRSDAQLFAARSLDASRAFTNACIESYGNFIRWPTKAIELARDLRGLAMGAVRAATLGEITGLGRSWESIAQHLTTELPLAQCLAQATQTVSYRNSPAARARLAYIAYLGCHGIESKRDQILPTLGQPNMILLNPFATDRQVPQLLLTQLEAVRQTASFLSSLPAFAAPDGLVVLLDRSTQHVFDHGHLHQVASRVNNVIAGLLEECRKGVLTPSEEVNIRGVHPIHTPGGYGFNGAITNRLTLEVEASCPEDPVEERSVAHPEDNRLRAGAAFLLAATMLDWGPAEHKGTYEQALLCAQDRASDFDHRAGHGETGLFARRKQSIYHGLNELGHVASDFTDGVARKSKAKRTKRPTKT